MKQGVAAVLVILNVIFASHGLLADTPAITLAVDATDAPRNLLHTHLHIPVVPGALTLFYPKWLPGTHSPEGPVVDVTGLFITAAGQTLSWQHDADNMYAVHLTVPAGVDAVDVAFDLLIPPGSSATAKLVDLDWNQVLMYPQTATPYQLTYVPTITLPTGWQGGTALTPVGTNGAQIQFAPVPLETLIDSPLVAGEYFQEIPLTPGETPAHYLDLIGDSPDALDITPEEIHDFTRLVREANANFGAHHYRSYHFLLTLSDHVAHFGLEHHESSDDRKQEDYLTNPSSLIFGADLLPHEMTHSWNGKYRRPAGLATPDYEQPMEGELLWVYEGLTDYLGKVLSTRAGLQTNSNFREAFAYTAAAMDHRAGRKWRPLADTGVCAQILYGARGDGTSRRRSVDFYPEGDLLWLEVDTFIRQQTHGQKSLVDFCHEFHGGPSGPPRVVPYTFADVVTALNDVYPYDWHGFFQTRVYDIAPHAPLGGIVNGGWTLVYTNQMSNYLTIREGQRKITDVSFSLGASFNSDGTVSDVIPGTVADAGGLASGMKLIAVNSRSWTPELLRHAIQNATTNTSPIELLMQNNDYFFTTRLDYHGGEKYPILVRNPAQPDILDDVLKPLTPETKN